MIKCYSPEWISLLMQTFFERAPTMSTYNFVVFLDSQTNICSIFIQTEVEIFTIEFYFACKYVSNRTGKRLVMFQIIAICQCSHVNSISIHPSHCLRTRSICSICSRINITCWFCFCDTICNIIQLEGITIASRLNHIHTTCITEE